MKVQINKNTMIAEDGFTLLGGEHLQISRPSPQETCWTCPMSLGEGEFRGITLRQGLEIWISDCTFHQDLYFRHNQLPPFFEFNFLLSGKSLVHLDGGGEGVDYSGRFQGISYYHNSEATCVVSAGVPVKCISVKVYQDFLHGYTVCGVNRMSEVLHGLMIRQKQSGILYLSDLSPNLPSIVDEINRCSLKGFSRTLFMESRALELISLQLEQIDKDLPGFHACSSGRLHPQDQKQTERTRSYLLTNLEKQHCLKDLAGIAGMSHPKLNRCFKQLYGMTVFEYLRNERLNRAKHIIEVEGMSVTEAAYEVGYDSLSHFSQAYKKQFGTSPSSRSKTERADDGFSSPYVRFAVSGV